MTNITITHAPSGLMQAEVLHRARISPSFVRVTLGGDDLRRFEYLGYDQWFRLALPADSDDGLESLPDRFDTRGLLRYLLQSKAGRPVLRNYTVRQFRPNDLELDVDFVVHGTAGVAGPWAASTTPGDRVALIDQGCGWKPVPADSVLLVADESGLPAVCGVLRDLPRDTVGHALIEIPDAADEQQSGAPDGVLVHWVVREPGTRPGQTAFDHLGDVPLSGTPYVFAVGESRLATGVRRWAVGERGIPKSNVTFCGYWKSGHAH